MQGQAMGYSLPPNEIRAFSAIIYLTDWGNRNNHLRFTPPLLERI